MIKNELIAYVLQIHKHRKTHRHRFLWLPVQEQQRRVVKHRQPLYQLQQQHRRQHQPKEIWIVLVIWPLNVLEKYSKIIVLYREW